MVKKVKKCNTPKGKWQVVVGNIGGYERSLSPTELKKAQTATSTRESLAASFFDLPFPNSFVTLELVGVEDHCHIHSINVLCFLYFIGLKNNSIITLK